jgi:hypothetical protein
MAVARVGGNRQTESSTSLLEQLWNANGQQKRRTRTRRTGEVPHSGRNRTDPPARIRCRSDSRGGQVFAVPSISRFLGISIWMYHNDHAPAHFHARYAGQEAVIDIESLVVLDGALPPRMLGVVRAWGRLRRNELFANWDLARRGLPLKAVEPPE